MYQAAQVMSKHFANRFIDLSRAGLAASVAKLGLDHVEGGFDVAPLVVALHGDLCRAA